MASSGGMYEYGMGLDDDDDEYEKGHREGKPSIVLMGAKRSGKTSIRKVVFQKMSPNETLFVESTSRVVTHTVTSSFIDFETKEFPGQLSPFDPAFDPQNTFSRCGALVFIIDAQDDYTDALKMLNDYVVKAYKMNSNIKFEVFVHKVDSLGDDLKIETHRDIYNRANDDLVDAQHENIHLSFHTTSIYDHSIFEAFSKVVQKLIPQLPTLERLLDIFNQSSCVEKCFLFDIASKIYVATDSTPVDMQTYELCCDMIDLQVDVSCIYGSVDEGNASPRSDEVECDEVVGRGASCVIRLSTHQVLYLREVNTYLALVCIVKEENFEKQGLIDYNFQCFKKAIDDVFELRRRMLRQKAVLKSRNNRDSATDTDISSDTDNRL